MDRHSLYENILKWIRSFNFVQSDIDINSILDGEIITEILYDIDSSYFDSEWKSKMTFDSNSNWKLKASNLKKIVNIMTDYLIRNKNVTLDNFHYPDVNEICENLDITEMSRMLQLVLLCAVNCSKKELYIQHIMAMESIVQIGIMNAIQELMNHEGHTEFQDNQVELSQFHIIQQEKESLKQKNHELESKLSLLNEEKLSLETELKLSKNKTALGSHPDQKSIKSKHEMTSAYGLDNLVGSDSSRIRQLQDKISSLQAELYQSEHFKDDYYQKSEQLELENTELRDKIENLNSHIQDQRHMKDELDITKERLKTLTGIEITLEKYKRKIDDTNELSRQNKLLEEENSKYLERIFKLEEEVKKTVSLKSQIDMYKSEITDIQSICSQKEKDFNKADFELKRAYDKLKTLEHDKINLQQQLQTLKTENEDLHLASYNLGSESSSENNSESVEMAVDDTAIDLMQIPLGLREKIIRWQKELRQLRQLYSPQSQLHLGNQQQQQYNNQSSSSIGGGSTDSHSGKSREQLIVSLEAAQARVNQLATENKQLHQENLILNAKIEDGDLQAASKGPNSAIDKLNEEKHQMESQYKVYLEKAKYVIYQLHRRLKQLEESKAEKNARAWSRNANDRNTPIGDGSDGMDDEDTDRVSRTKYEALQATLYQKQREFEELNKQFEQAQQSHEDEEKMLVAAWYNLGVRLNREASIERLQQRPLTTAAEASPQSITTTTGSTTSNNTNSDPSVTAASAITPCDWTSGLTNNEPGSFLARQRLAHLNKL